MKPVALGEAPGSRDMESVIDVINRVAGLGHPLLLVLADRPHVGDRVRHRGNPARRGQLAWLGESVAPTRQKGGWEWSQLTEVSVNLYSLTFQRHLGQPSRLNVLDAEGNPGTKMWDNALLLRPKIAAFDDLPVFERLVPLEQLRIAYGVEFWARLHRRYGDPTTRPMTTDDESRRQAFIVEASRAAEQDLRGFLGAWALRANTATDVAVVALALPVADTAALLALRP